MKYLFYILIPLIISCQNRAETKQEDSKKNKNLIYFNSHFMADLGDDEWYKLQPKMDSAIKAQYLDDVIYVTKYIDVNACGTYVGDIEIKNDTIYLIHRLVSDDICATTSINKVIYIIKNPNQKKYKMIIRYE
jgi:hypothetical protein